ncbi:hypothetical protein [Nocardioides speluncae]|uniref:hypothetical protein n=1 Tax=Nocardioides speluncae TaxID=2670337 RepID=UPI000D69D20C|nr:hypothetical protein [Nocardioides speluncae]
MAAQLFTLLGVVAGALASYLATSAAERARYKRQMATRWDERRLQTYIEFSTCVKDISANASRAREADDEASRDAFVEAMELAELQRTAHFEKLMLLASTPAIDVTHTVNQLIWREEIATRKGEVLDDPGLVEALNAFYAAARRDLGLDASTPVLS